MELVQTTINFRVRKTRSQVKKNLFDYDDDKSDVQSCLRVSPIKLSSKNGSQSRRKTGKSKSSNKNVKSRTSKAKDEGISSQENCTPLEKSIHDKAGNVIPISPKRGNNTPVSQSSNASPLKRIRTLTFDDENKTPRCVTLVKQDVTPYHKAKQALHTSTPSRILCRNKELTNLDQFLNTHLKTKTSGCLYISGAPGTGKTACLQQFINSHKAKESFCSIFVNCMTIRNSKSIYENIAQELGCSTSQTIKETIQRIEKRLTIKGDPVIMILDEMDQLSTKNQEVLYTIFEWPRLQNSRLILIGIANALDLTDRLLPRLHACGSKPKLLHFMPYSQSQIQEILKDRLNEALDANTVIIKPEAVQFCARKIAASTGDIRKALDTCRRALDIAERGAKTQQILNTISDECCNAGSPKKRDIPPTSVVGLPQIMNVLHDIYNSQVLSSGTSKSSDFDATMPIQQKLLLCVLLLLTKHSKIKDITVGKLHEIHRRVCRKRQIGEVEPSEFMTLCDLVESRGMINLKKGKEARMIKVILKTNEDDLQFVLQDKNLLASVLEDQSVLKP